MAARAVTKPEAPEAPERVGDRGYLGVEVDPTPDAHYSVAGVTSGLPTPESERSHA